MISAREMANIFKVSCEDIAVSENLAEYVLKCRIPVTFDDLKELSQQLSTTPSCDSTTISLNCYGDLHSETKFGEDDLLRFFNKLREVADEDDSLELTIKVSKKPTDDTLSIYDFETFCKWVTRKNYVDWLSALVAVRSDPEGFTRFICYNDDVLIRTSGFCFCAPEHSLLSTSNGCRVEKISKRTDVCNLIGFCPQFVPEDFKVNITDVQSEFTDYLERTCLLLSIAFLVDQATITGNSIAFSIKGYRTVEEKIDVKQTSMKNSCLYQIYEWIYTDGNVSDKSQIARNIMSLHCRYKEFLTIDGSVFSAIKSNYTLYLKECVKDYLTLKKDVVEAVQQYTNSIGDAISNFYGQLKGNLVVIFGYLVTVVFAKGFESNDGAIFTYDVAILSSFVLLGSLLFCLVSVVEVYLKYGYYGETIKSLKLQYSDTMDETEIRKNIDGNELLKFAKRSFRRSAPIVAGIWIVITIALFLMVDKLSGEVRLLFLFDFLK